MIDIAYILKLSPIAAFIAVGAMGYGEIKADIHNLQITQTQQFQQIQSNLDRIEDRINKK